MELPPQRNCGRLEGKTLTQNNSSPSDELARALDEVRAWLDRFVIFQSPSDLDVMALWTAHTWAMDLVRTTPRILVDSPMPESGKTTLLEHLRHLCMGPMHAAALSSPALLPRMLAQGPRTILLDEADRSLNPQREGVGELVAVINAGYKQGATRPVLAPSGGDWEARELPTYAPVVMAGNAPRLPDDTRSRCIRVLLMPDLAGQAEESDWEELEEDAEALRSRLAEAVAGAGELIDRKPELPEGCRGRMAEKWRPLTRVAAAAGQKWLDAVHTATTRNMEEMQQEKEAGLIKGTPQTALLRDLAECWPGGVGLWRSQEMAEVLAERYPGRWGEGSRFGRALTVQRMGQLLTQGFKISASRDSLGTRGYLLADFRAAFGAFGLDQIAQTDETVRTDETVKTVKTTGAASDEVVHDWPTVTPGGFDGLDGSDGLDGLDGMGAETGKRAA